MDGKLIAAGIAGFFTGLAIILIIGSCVSHADGKKDESTPAPREQVQPKQTAAPAEPTALDKLQHESELPQQQETQNTTTNRTCRYVQPYNTANSEDPKGGWDEGCNTKEFQAREVFDIDNCRVYRFNDGVWHYFQDCSR